MHVERRAMKRLSLLLTRRQQGKKILIKGIKESDLLELKGFIFIYFPYIFQK
jgi:hypothetical protein